MRIKDVELKEFLRLKNLCICIKKPFNIYEELTVLCALQPYISRFLLQ